VMTISVIIGAAVLVVVRRDSIQQVLENSFKKVAVQKDGQG